ncbi:SRPBCC family protein [Actinomycetospora cinnamomea]|uniref:Polyketide cyclase/dehydrase/lipid transport protein n=1 Tax=Actinomycetospora cinnamomea TaxID=663609 RepID=A0A2U1EYK8_9PSEU|nr:SRPBCC family protein [Actinomycetospora cinnamomea]PVZ04992.1 polyketide cyclase/dehydrase/lipid transport protein [Actinomycetospora cinnamomea]
MVTVVNRLDVDAAPETVFDHVADLRTEAVWNPACRRVDLLGREPLGVGSRFRGTWHGMGTADAEILAFDRPWYWRTRLRFRGVDVDIVGEVTDRERGCHLTLTLELGARGVARPLLPPAGVVLRAAGRRNMRRLAEMLTMPGV